MNNNDLAQRSRSFVWHPCTQMKGLETLPLLAIRRAEGVWLHDHDGNRILDAISSWWVNLFGHCNPRINAALKAQLDTLEHVMLAGFTHEPVVALSEKLARLTGLGHAFYGSDGASATEIALKMSFHYWRNNGHPHKNGFVNLHQSYHGETLGALAVTDIAIFKDTYAPLLRGGVQVPSPDWRLAKDGESPQIYARRCAQVLDDYLAAHHEEIAAVILEPLVQGAAGMAMYHADYLRLARSSCDRYQVHLIADEIAVGFGRTGTMFACEQANITPDFICLSKGLTGGYLPLSAVLTTDAVYAAFYDDAVTRAFLHSHSYTGNALACRAALATLEIFEQDKVLDANRVKQSRMNAALEPLRELPIKHLRNTGMIWAFDVPDAPAGFPRRFYQEALAHGLLLRPIGNTVYFMPPYVISDEEIEILAEQTVSVLKKVIT
ncbi:MAG: adenosylmethionine--8-amino-7-oxononanoate transaminase [Methylobacillus sp.]|jgi:adenosylmethionine-8-amino-7-oxononanoate aminotransferase|nr:adenosylmethionine--8-amino-7-oxononanoate transaminase [Methylobacillus sp.]